jgi:Family of unknown function (DUF6328)
MAATATDVIRPADDGREETQLEQLDRNTNELVQEMRVAAVGIQVLLAFLLVVPFQTGWKNVTSFDRHEYFVTLVSIAIAAARLIAPRSTTGSCSANTRRPTSSTWETGS